MSFNESLFAQLNTSQSFSIQSWGMIAREIKNQTKLIDEINTSFSDKLAAMMSLTDSNYVGLGLSIFGFSFACFMFWKSVAPQQYEKLKANFKDSGKTLVEKVKTAGRKVNLTSMDEEGRMNDTEITPE